MFVRKFISITPWGLKYHGAAKSIAQRLTFPHVELTCLYGITPWSGTMYELNGCALHRHRAYV